MTVYGFTGARNFNPNSRHLVLDVLRELSGAEGFVTGAAKGIDAVVGSWLYVSYVQANHTVVIPSDRSRVDYWWVLLEPHTIDLIEMPPGTTYKDRNQKIVDLSDQVIGFPEYLENDPRSQRSGTWQTIRMASRAGKLNRVVYIGY